MRARRLDEPRGGAAGGPATVTFLEDLVHPDTGQPLLYPPPATRGSAAFVPEPEARRVDALPGGSGDGAWMMAALDPSPAAEREKHANPYLCMVRPGSLRRLAAVPDEWNLRVTGVTGARLVAEGAREAVEARLAEETGRSRAGLEAARRALADTERERAAVVRTAEEAQARLEAGERRLVAVEAEIERSRADMDDRRRRLASFMRERGQRLLALDLIDEDQLRALGADEAPPDDRPGASLTDALGGDFGRVAGFVQAFARRRDMLYGQAQLRDVLACLRTHDLVVLAGDPGAGKSSLVRHLAAAIGASLRRRPGQAQLDWPRGSSRLLQPHRGSLPFDPLSRGAARGRARTRRAFPPLPRRDEPRPR
ncbi:hypothetical protein Rumeso_04438 [Rubellimicrobium mesophilum DSM 19309]|uniref:Uncharacterized protein n=1 Tax=Rubellimicrobium mesophilum DSM 19309 TaxID=442562 RepID=A0A017HHX7_9RHOB|nr:hypothetical protein Rumeso_04438 [Rubellimicrobium mesophilum DSM 19309]